MPRRYASGNMKVTVTGRTAMLLAGDLKVEDLDDEELARGYCKDKNGKFTGRPPLVVPRELHARMRQELLKRGEQVFAESFVDAITALAEIAKNKKVKESDRIRAAQYVVERIAGKVPDKVELSAADPWQMIIDRIIVEDATVQEVSPDNVEA